MTDPAKSQAITLVKLDHSSGMRPYLRYRAIRHLIPILKSGPDNGQAGAGDAEMAR
jgi:hypothetical protein